MLTVVLLAAVAALGWSGVFPSGGGVALLAVVGAASAAATALLALSRLGPAARVSALVGGFLLVAAAVAERSPPTPAAMAAVGRGLRDGWAEILDTRLPVEPQGGPMITAVAVVWLAGCLAATAQLAGRPTLRLAPPLGALAAGLLFGGAAGATPVGLAVAVVAALGLVLVAPDRRDLRRGARSVAAASSVVAVVAIMGTAWPGASAREPFDPRDLRHQPVAVAPTDNPLARLGAAVDDDENPELFRARVRGEVHRWRLVVLDRFDADGWTASSTYRRVGAGLRGPELDPDVAVNQVDQAITLVGLGGPFLPAAATPIAADVEVPGDGDAPELAADDAGILALGSSGMRPERYHVRSTVPHLTGAVIEAARPATIADAPRLDPVRRAAYQRFFDQAVRDGNPSGAGRLSALALWFREDLRLAPTGPEHDPPPTGNGLFHIDRFFHDGMGTSEQFAAAFALLARLQGYDARVAVGYRPGTRHPETGQLVVRSHDAHAWPEVRFEGIGWVAFDPTPADVARSRTTPDQPPEPATRSAAEEVSPTTAPAAEGADAAAADAAAERPAAQESADERRSWPATLALMVAAAAAVALIAGVGVVAAKAQRQRRQQRGSAAQRVAGAWSAALDRLREAGVAVPRHLAATEVVDAPGVPDAAVAPLSTLAQLANGSRFSPTPATTADADAAWTAAVAVATAVRAQHPALRLALSPAPLLYWHAPPSSAT